MSLTRKALATMGIEEDKIDQIIEMHTGVTTELKTELDKAKAKADLLPEVQRELKELQEQVAKQGDENPYEVKYNALKEEFETYKTGIETEKTKAKKESAYKKALKDAGVSERRIESVARVSSSVIDGIEFDEEGKVKDADKLVESIKKEWADFIVEEKTKGADTATPPTNTGGSAKTKSEIMAITDRSKRREAIAENPELFGIKTKDE